LFVNLKKFLVWVKLEIKPNKFSFN